VEADGQGLPVSALPLTPTQALLSGFDTGAPFTGAQFNARRGASAQALADEQRRQGFVVGGLRLMIRFEEGSELAEMPTLYRLPNVPPWFKGFANLQGVLIPVFDLARYLGLDSKPPARPLLLVLSHGDNAAGVVIDGMPQRLRWSQQDASDASAAPARLAPHVRGASLIEDQLWFDLECNSLLDALEHAMETPS
jgi:chemotaxis signal transduction protein